MKKKAMIFMSIFSLILGNGIVSYATDEVFQRERLTESAVYADIQKEEESIKESIAMLIYENEDPPSDFNPVLQYEQAEKVYVDTGIEKQKYRKESDIRNYLDTCNYIWIIPTEVDGKQIQVTAAQEQPSNPDKSSDSTEENEGKWEITEVALRTTEPYADQMRKKSDLIDGYVLVGGVPGLSRMPAAIGFKDGEAKYWIELGYQYEILEEMAKTKDAEEGIYDYSTVTEKLANYEAGSNKSVIVAIGIIALIAIIGVGVLYVVRKRK